MATLQRNQPTVHLDGNLHFKTCKDGMYSRLFAQLKGKELLLYPGTDKRTKMQPQKTISLNGVISVKKEMTGRAIKQNSAFPTISVTFSTECDLNEFRLRASNQAEQEEWFRYLYTVCLGKLPSNLDNLLPGQVQKLNDIVDSITYDDVGYLDMKPAPLTPSPRTPVSAPLTPSPRTPVSGGQAQSPGAFSFNRKMSVPAVLPSSTSATLPIISNRRPCFPIADTDSKAPQSTVNKSWFINGNVGRDEAENILNSNKEYGNMLLRRRSTTDNQDPWNFAVSIKSSEPGEKQYKHYKIKEIQEGTRVHYVINLAAEDSHERLYSFQDIIDCFVKKSLGANLPLKRISSYPEHEYETAVETLPPYIEPQDDYYNVRGGSTIPIRSPLPTPAGPPTAPQHNRPPMMSRNTMPALLQPKFRNELNNVLGKTG